MIAWTIANWPTRTKRTASDMTGFLSRLKRLAETAKRALPAVLAAAILHAVDARADPLIGQALVFQQQPMIVTGVGNNFYFGSDEISTLNEDPAFPGKFSGDYKADDFALRSAGSIVHLRWWGSHIDDVVGAGVRQFLIAFEPDAPVALPNRIWPLESPNCASLRAKLEF